MSLGDVGDDPPQAENSVASVAPEAAWQAPAQNRRRETGAFASDIVMLVRGAGSCQVAISRPLTNDPVFADSAVPGGFRPITNWGERRAIL
jgi:hypothetical protein